MDDALYIRKEENGQLSLYIAIADPTAYIQPNSELDTIAAQRALTNYLPGFNIPMLPRELSDNLCSLRPNEKRPALVCQVGIMEDGALTDEIHFYSAWVESKAKLVYDNISDWLEGIRYRGGKTSYCQPYRGRSDDHRQYLCGKGT